MATTQNKEKRDNKENRCVRKKRRDLTVETAG